MKRLSVCALFLLIVLDVSAFAQSQTPAKTGSFLELCYKLWKGTSFGWNQKKTERAAWVIRDGDRHYQWQDWYYTDEPKKSTWKGEVPEGVVAVIHTHPEFTNPKPSSQDAKVAQKINAPVYTLSGSGIWRVGPDGKITQEADDKWYRQIKNVE